MHKFHRKRRTCLPIVVAVVATATIGGCSQSGNSEANAQQTALDAQGDQLMQEADRDSADMESRTKPNEIEIVSTCDMAVKQSLISENSYDSDSAWSYIVNNGVAKVLRKFSATNGFGANISSAYYCEYNVAAAKITFLQTTGPYGANTVIGSPPPSTSGHHRKQHHRG